MELKRIIRGNPTAKTLLLIVPYGIETWNYATQEDQTQSLLIVPYGIETSIAAGK